MQIAITIAEPMKVVWPVTLGVLHAEEVHVRCSAAGLTQLLPDAASQTAARVPDLKNLADTSPLALARAAYRAYGANPKRHPPSSEALAERVARGKGMYTINNLVD